MQEQENTGGEGQTQASLFRAAEYVRMSTEHQQYSTENQADKIREYAARRGIEIIKTYADAGKSGLRIDGRQALQQLIKDVETGAADFQIILVYDVSRWGRFQDADESAYYEYICRRAGIQVAYCAEQFENDGSPVSTIVKGVKRAMAGEYSRELSTKVFADQCRLIELGYRQGGPAGYGLRRILVDQNGSVKSELARGEHKSLQTDRVILMPGPDDETRIVNLIYQWFIEEGLSESQIAGRLNGMKVRTDLDREWTRSTVNEVLTNEKYIGNNVYNRISFKLKKTRVVNTPDMWIKKEGAFDAIVQPDLFYTAQGIMRARARRYTDEELIERLRNLYENRGILSGLIIDESEGIPSASVYVHRFGSLIRAYQMVGFTPDRDYRYLEVNRFLRQLHPEIVAQTEAQIAAIGGTVVRDPATDISAINKGLDEALARFADRPLDEPYPHLILDARYERVRDSGVIAQQAVLIAIGINWEGKRQVLAVEMANRESQSSWKDFLLRLKERGLSGVEFVVSDDHAGLKKAIFAVLTEAAWQRCYVHFLRNALDYLPRKADDDCLQELRWIYDRRDIQEAQQDLAAWIGKWQGKYPKLVDWVEGNIIETLTFYRLPRAHHKHLKSTNMLERLNEEIKRRTLVVRIFPNRESCLRLIRALCVETHETWLEDNRYLNMTFLAEQKKELLRLAA